MIQEDFSKRLVTFSVSIIKLAEKYSDQRALQSVFNQLIRCAGSIGANVNEAQGASSGKDFINFFHIALKSSEETRYWLTVLVEHGAIPPSEITPSLDETTAFIKILSSSISTAKKKILLQKQQ